MIKSNLNRILFYIGGFVLLIFVGYLILVILYSPQEQIAEEHVNDVEEPVDDRRTLTEEEQQALLDRLRGGEDASRSSRDISDEERAELAGQTATGESSVTEDERRRFFEDSRQ